MKPVLYVISVQSIVLTRFYDFANNGLRESSAVLSPLYATSASIIRANESSMTNVSHCQYLVTVLECKCIIPCTFSSMCVLWPKFLHYCIIHAWSHHSLTHAPPPWGGPPSLLHLPPYLPPPLQVLPLYGPTPTSTCHPTKLCI